jgi:hypothetical protein
VQRQNGRLKEGFEGGGDDDRVCTSYKREDLLETSGYADAIGMDASDINTVTSDNKVEFESPLLIEKHDGPNVVNFTKFAQFDDVVSFEPGTTLNLNANVNLNSESSIYFDENDLQKRLKKDDIIPMKKAIGKKDYIMNTTQDVAKFRDGDLVSRFASKTGGIDICTSILWDILIGKTVEPSSLCEACCLPEKTHGRIQALLVYGHNEFQLLDLDASTTTARHILIDVNIPKNRNIQILLYKSKSYIQCRLVLTAHASEIQAINMYDITEVRKKMTELLEREIYNNVMTAGIDSRDDDVEWGHVTQQTASYTVHKLNKNFVSDIKYAYLEYIETL